MARKPLLSAAPSRRQLLTGAAGLAAMSGLSSAGLLGAAYGSRAAVGSRRLLVVIADGGWDSTFAIDPKLDVPDVDGPVPDQDPDNPLDVEEIATFGEFRVAVNRARRPNVAALFEAHADRLCVINGIWVGIQAHFEARTRMLTGTNDRTVPDLSTIFGVGTPAPIAAVDMSGMGRVGPYGDRTALFGQKSQLAQLVDPSLRMPAGPSTPVGYRKIGLDEDDRIALEQFLADRTASDPLVALPNGAELVAARTEALSRAQRLNSFQVASGEMTSIGGQLLAAVDLFEQGVTDSIIACTSTFDTHTLQAMQHGLWDDLCRSLRLVLDGLEARDLLSTTTVLVVSEFGRMPQRNSYDGADHFPHTSAIMFGGGVTGGRVLGKTNDLLQSLPMSLETGEVDSKGEYLRPANLVAGVLESLDVDPGDWVPGVTPFRGFRA